MVILPYDHTDLLNQPKILWEMRMYYLQESGRATSSAQPHHLDIQKR